jgi:hypothetical protein
MTSRNGSMSTDFRIPLIADNAVKVRLSNENWGRVVHDRDDG